VSGLNSQHRGQLLPNESSGAVRCTRLRHPADGQQKFDETEPLKTPAPDRADIARLVAGVFETTFDGTEVRKQIIADRAYALVEEMLSEKRIDGRQAAEIRAWAQESISRELAAL